MQRRARTNVLDIIIFLNIMQWIVVWRLLLVGQNEPFLVDRCPRILAKSNTYILFAANYYQQCDVCSFYALTHLWLPLILAIKNNWKHCPLLWFVFQSLIIIFQLGFFFPHQKSAKIFHISCNFDFQISFLIIFFQVISFKTAVV